ncbi:hypothetical protein [Mycobacterium sp.]|nr:hypothetical protein [Mycobacterium sp.]HXB86317.1 hypothetical protein [Mycobacterium sp.]
MTIRAAASDNRPSGRVDVDAGDPEDVNHATLAAASPEVTVSGELPPP